MLFLIKTSLIYRDSKPAGQNEQFSPLNAGWYVPLGQPKQDLLPVEFEYQPGWQSVQIVQPEELQNLPFSHSMHFDWPVKFW